MTVTINGTTGIASPGGDTNTSLTSSGNHIAAAIIPTGATVPANGTFLPAANSLGFSTNSTERMRIDSSGNLCVNVSSPVSVGAGAHVLSLKSSGTSSSWGVGPTNSFGNFYIKAAASYGVVLTSTATSWASDSDERKKTALTPFDNPVEKICSLRAGTGRYLADDEAVSRSFLIAQDVQAVLPEAVDVGEDEDKSLVLRYTDVIPLLVAAIQELEARVKQLEAK